MTAVTIGSREYLQDALTAAVTIANGTGLETVVLGDRDQKKFRLRHPKQLKCYLFDIIDDEDILYFDPDMRCISTWDPTQFSAKPHFICVRDVFQTVRVRTNARKLKIPRTSYFNAGLFICNRKCHQDIFELGKRLRSEFVCDPAHLNKLIFNSRTPVRFLDRRYNWIDFQDGEVSRIYKPIAVHRTSRNSILVESMLDDHNSESDSEYRIMVCEDLAGLYSYTRVGRDSRRIFLCEDGTIIHNWARLEWYWFVYTRRGSERHLVICDDKKITCDLIEKSGSWHGRWSRFEKMKIVLERCAS